MSSRKPRPYLVVLDVGHGSAAVLHDEGSTVVFDAGPNAHVGRYLQATSVNHVQALLLSHSDSDHIGGAITLLLDIKLKIEEVLLNSDASKESAVFMQLCVALADANRRARTRIDRRLVTSTRIERTGAQIEVLHPPDAWALAGVGAKSASGGRHTSNSLSAAIRVSRGPKSSVLLGADIEYDCLDGWKERSIQPTATALVFPHHGGLPGTSGGSEAELFAFELTQMVNPEYVVFSNHKTKFDNPRTEIVSAISKANKSVKLACTQLPQRLHSSVKAGSQWSLHQPTKGTVPLEGSICLEFVPTGIRATFGERP